MTMDKETEKQALEAFLIDKQFAADWTAQMLEWRKDEISYDWRLWCRSWEARGRASGQQGVEGYCWMPKELTAENGAKAALIGEFEEEHQGSRLIHVQISWTTIKEIYKAAVAHFAASPQITSPAAIGNDVAPLPDLSAIMDAVRRNGSTMTNSEILDELGIVRAKVCRSAKR